MLKAYVTNLGMYNEGRLVGEWVDLPLEEDFATILKRIGVDGERYEEYFVTDWKSDELPEAVQLLGEYENVEILSEILKQVDDAETLNAYLEYASVGLKTAIEECANRDIFLLKGMYTDWDLGCYWVEKSGCYDISSIPELSRYFDYESIGRNCRLECEGYFAKAGWLEIH